MISRLKTEEEGMALITAIISLVIMLALGLATLSFVSGQRELGTGERLRESAFNLAEALLNSQIFLVARSWPGSSGSAYPTSCSSATAATKCPDPTTIGAQFTNPDYANASWSTAVKDNGGAASDYYSTTATPSQPSYDANSDGKLWIRAQGVVKSVRRTIVAQVKAEVRTIPLPKNVVTAGYFGTTNNGRKVIIDTNGKTYSANPGQPGKITVRCTSGPRSGCLNYDASKGQVSPPAYETSYPGTSAVTSDQLNAMRGTAQLSNTYYSSGCPSSLSGSLVFIENGNCTYTTGTFNSLASPGMVVIATGTLTLGGNSNYNGLVYAANLQNSSGYVVSLQGCAKIIGGVAVDGAGGVLAGSCGTNIAFNGNVFGSAKAYGTPAPVKGTWREIAG